MKRSLIILCSVICWYGLNLSAMEEPSKAGDFKLSAVKGLNNRALLKMDNRALLKMEENLTQSSMYYPSCVSQPDNGKESKEECPRLPERGDFPGF